MLQKLKTDPGLLGDPGLVRIDDVHDEPALAHLGQTGLDHEGALRALADNVGGLVAFSISGSCIGI